VTTECQRKESGHDDEDVRLDLGRPHRSSTPALIADAHDESLDETGRRPCVSITTTAAGAPEAVRWLLTLANQLLRGSSDEERRHLLGRPTTLEWSPLERVARLRDELHATANRVARFAVDDCPSVDPVRVTAPTAASVVLPPEQLLFQLDLTAGRLIALLTPLSSRDWTRTCLMGDRVVTLGQLVERVLDGAAHDLIELLQAAPPAPEGVVTLTHGRSRRDRREAHLQTYSATRKANQDAAAF
jgi:hypothetical protein